MSVAKGLRVLTLLVILLLVAVTQCRQKQRLVDWSEPLRVAIYPIAAVDTADSRAYLATLTDEDFAPVGAFLQREARRYGVVLDDPFRFFVAEPGRSLPPRIEPGASWWQVAAWSLRARWWAFRQSHDDGITAPDVRIFLVLRRPEAGLRLDNSVGLTKGAFGIVYGVGDRRYEGRNRVVLAHELLHVIGATDKYAPETGEVFDPQGLAEPNRQPTYPQRYAEIMAGRIPLSPQRSRMPSSLRECVVGPSTAIEIGWLKAPE